MRYPCIDTDDSSLGEEMVADLCAARGYDSPEGEPCCTVHTERFLHDGLEVGHFLAFFEGDSFAAEASSGVIVDFLA